MPITSLYVPKAAAIRFDGSPVSNVTEQAVQRLLAAGSMPQSERSDTADLVPLRRRKIWHLDTNLHCSIIGTCLTLAELKSLARKLNPTDAAGNRSEHDLHGMVVGFAGKPDPGGRLIHKLLDRKFVTVIAQFDRLASLGEVRSLWQSRRESGDIPGAYWAALTHPASSYEFMRQAFGEVHMLSHLVGAANRADIRRLQTLEDERTSLHERLEQEQRLQREKLAEKDEQITVLESRVRALAAEAIVDRINAGDAGDERNAEYAAAAKELRDRFERQAARLAHLEQRAAELESSANGLTSELSKRDAEIATLSGECLRLEQALANSLVATGQHEGTLATAERDLRRRRILYVGGRGQQVPYFRALVERQNGQFLHHDGGLEENSDSLAGSLGRADAVLFPVDCISHAGYQKLKSLCRRHGTPYVPLRTSSLAAFTRALGELATNQQQAPV